MSNNTFDFFNVLEYLKNKGCVFMVREIKHNDIKAKELSFMGGPKKEGKFYKYGGKIISANIAEVIPNLGAFVSFE